MNKQQEIKLLLDRYFAGTASPEEEAMLESWYLQYPLENRQTGSVESENQKLAEVEGVLEHLVGKNVWGQLWPRIALVAAALATITLSVWLYSIHHNDADDLIKFVSGSHDITPGSNKATLTLENGKIIQLSEAKGGIVVGNDLRYSDNTSVIANAEDSLLKSPPYGDKNEVNLLTASTPRGGIYEVTLSDGSKVHLNAASKLIFPSAFAADGKRIVELSGEAYFEIAKDKRHPFIVKSKGQEVEVLGTHFNVNAYPDEPTIKTTLIEGVVRVSLYPENPGQYDSNIAEKTVTLMPGQQAAFANESLKVGHADIERSLDWINGKFVFRDEDLVSIMRKIALWYDIEVVYLDDVSDLTYFGVVSRHTNISSVLEYFGKTGNVKFSIKGKKITVSKNN